MAKSRPASDQPKDETVVPDLAAHLHSDLQQKLAAGGSDAVEEFLRLHLSLERGPELLLKVIEIELADKKKIPAAERNALLGRYKALAQEMQNQVTTTFKKATVQAPKKPPLPKKIGRFEVRGLLGAGAFGAVYRAHDAKLDREVAVKVPKPGVLQTERDRKRFFREAQAAAGLRDPNICAVHEVHDDDDPPYIVMDYIAGKSLADYVRERKEPLPERQSAIIVFKLALALDAAHKKGIIHRDLKPANIMIDLERKDVVIMDFGLARRTTPGNADATQHGVIAGTPAYMSPEQARGDTKAVSPASDIFSLGVILYELLTGVRPFQGSVVEVLGKLQHVEPTPPAKVRAGVDARLAAICMKALAKEPGARFASMKELAQALSAYAKEAPAPKSEEATRTQEASPYADVLAALNAENKATAEAVERSQRGLVKWLVGGLVCVGVTVCFTGVVVAVAIWLFSRVGPDGAPKGSDLISVKLTNLTYINDNSVHYYLDGTKIDSARLREPIELAPKEYTLVAKKGDVELETRKFIVAPADHQAEVVAFLPEQDGEPGMVQTIKHPGQVTGRGIGVSPDGEWVLSAWGDKTNHYLTLWDLKKEQKLDERENLYAMKPMFCGKGKLAAWGVNRSYRGDNALSEAYAYDLALPKRWKDIASFKCGQNGSANQVHLARDGSILLMGCTGAEHRLIAIRVSDGKQLLDVDDFVYPVGAVSIDGKHIFASAVKDLRMYSVDGDKATKTRVMKGHTSPITCVGVSPDGKLVAAGTDTSSNSARAWSIADGKELEFYAGHSGRINAIHFSPDSKRLLTASDDETVWLWDVKTGERTYKTEKQGQRVIDACFTPSGRRCVFQLADGTIKVWQLPQNK